MILFNFNLIKVQKFTFSLYIIKNIRSILKILETKVRTAKRYYSPTTLASWIKKK